MLVKILPPTPPAGVHRMRLVGRDEIIGRYQTPAFKWTFQVESGDHSGEQATKTTGLEVRMGESLHELLAELLGREMQVGSNVDLDEPMGKLFDVLLSTRSGSSSGVMIRKVTPASE